MERKEKGGQKVREAQEVREGERERQDGRMTELIGSRQEWKSIR